MGKRERYKISVAVFLIAMDDDKICFIKRTHTDWMDGYYSIPAGSVEPGESLTQAIEREAYEEVAIHIDMNELEHVHTMHCVTEGNEWLGIYFKSEEWSGKAKINEAQKHTDMKWKKLTSMPENTIPYIRQALECFARGIFYSEYGWEKK